MRATRSPSIASQRDARNATLFFGHGAGRWLAVQERHRSAFARAERARLLNEAGVSVAAMSVVLRMRRSIGAAFVRIGLRLQAAAGQPARAIPR